MSTYDEYEKGLSAAVDFESDYRKKLQRKRNAALVTDIATNLLSLFSRAHGGRVPVTTNGTAAVNSKIAESEQRMVDAMRDYSGRKAALSFKELFEGRGDGMSQTGAPARNDKPISIKRNSLQPGMKLVTLTPGLLQKKIKLIDIKPFDKAKRSLSIINNNTNKNK